MSHSKYVNEIDNVHVGTVALFVVSWFVITVTPFLKEYGGSFRYLFQDTSIFGWVGVACLVFLYHTGFRFTGQEEKLFETLALYASFAFG
ncbi:membrane protein, partial [Candidatus Magnetomorum sp. HK-1]